MPLAPFKTPGQAMAYASEQLDAAVSDPKHDWHWPQLATSDPGGAGVRVVVLRDFDRSAPRFTFYTDRRAAKVQGLTNGSGAARAATCEASFYHRGDRIQLRLRGSAELFAENVRTELWQAMQPRGKLSYATVDAPGSVLAEAGDGLSGTWREGRPTDLEDERAFANFYPYGVSVANVQLLQLSDSGQRRCAWEAWSATTFAWLVP